MGSVYVVAAWRRFNHAYILRFCSFSAMVTGNSLTKVPSDQCTLKTFRLIYGLRFWLTKISPLFVDNAIHTYIAWHRSSYITHRLDCCVIFCSLCWVPSGCDRSERMNFLTSISCYFVSVANLKWWQILQSGCRGFSQF